MTLAQTLVKIIKDPFLIIAFLPVLIAASMAFGDGIWHWPSVALVLTLVFFSHIGVNLINEGRKSPNSLLNVGSQPPQDSPSTSKIPPSWKTTAYVLFACILVISVLLIKRGGWPIGSIGILVGICIIFYLAGRHPLAHYGMGDALAFIFLGPVTVCGTYYVQTFEMNAAVFYAGFASGLFGVAAVSVDNLLDLEGDRRQNKKTFAVRFGRGFVLSEYLFAVIGACLIPVVIYSFAKDHVLILSAVSTCLFAVPVIKVVLTRLEESSLERAIKKTSWLGAIYFVLFSIGWIFS